MDTIACICSETDRILGNRTFMPVHRITTANFIESVIPADYNQDGRLDVLVLTKGVNDDEKWWSSSKQGTLDGRVHIQTPSGMTSMCGITGSSSYVY